ncbi:MAG: dodecin family protein [Gammaproteobacteria bacterium]|nr:dodecin family protein [Gammaproteobacteria bacterium]
MSDKVYKTIRLTGCSEESYEKAIKVALGKAGESLHGVSWFTVTEMRGGIRDGATVEYQATVEVAFKID